MGAKLSKAQRLACMDKALEMVRENPNISLQKISVTLGLNKGVVWDWQKYNREGFGDRYRETLKEAFNDLEAPAIGALKDLLDERNFQAVKYVLDNRGYKAADKVEQVSDTTISINIVGENENG